LAILPAAPLRDRREEHLDLLLRELVAHVLLVAGARPERVPLRCPWRLRAGHHWPRLRVALTFSSPTSQAFLISSFFQSMIACARSFSRNPPNSTRRFSVAMRSAMSLFDSSNGLMAASLIDSILTIW